MGSLDIQKIRGSFPILNQRVGEKPLAYLDNAATSQKPLAVLEAVDRFYRESNANVHRGVHFLSEKSTKQFDEAREKVRSFLNAILAKEIIFTKGCTEGINLVANAFSSPSALWLGTAAKPLQAGDVILLSQMEHHSDIVPWQLAAIKTGAQIKVIPMLDNGELDLEAYAKLLNEQPVKIVGIVHISNALGTINPVKKMIEMAHRAGALVLVDGAQAGPHLRLDVNDLDADFYTLSCHKIYAPTGVGVLYGKQELLESFPPYQGGGDMIESVAFENTRFAPLPAKFEAGTPNVAGVIGLGAAIDYLKSLAPSPVNLASPEISIDEAKSRIRQMRLEMATFTSTEPSQKEELSAAFEAMAEAEQDLLTYATEQMSQIPGLRIIGTAERKASVLSFVLDCAHPHDIGTILNSEGVAIRAGHHCCMPLMKRLGLPATARASFAYYNTRDEVDALVSGVKKVVEMFK